MKKLYSTIIIATLLLSMMPIIMAVSVGNGVGTNINTERFAPLVFLCDNRVMYDDNTEPGRISPGGAPLVERINNYAFEGEQVTWKVLVMDKNGINKVRDVFATIGEQQGLGNEIQANCIEDLANTTILPSCNARILEESITTFNSATMRYYDCSLTVETPEAMYGQYWLTVEAEDIDGDSGTMAENEFWFFNPVIALSIDGEPMTFNDVRPGTSAYSNTLLVGNDADASSGVMMDMFISGTDFYDSSSSGAMCPTTNQLKLGDGDSACDSSDPFCYYATNGAYSTLTDNRKDVEGYVGINYGIGFNNPNPFYEEAVAGAGTGYELIQGLQQGPYFVSNLLAPGSEMAVTVRLNLPEPCNGDFDTGSIYFWGEAI